MSQEQKRAAAPKNQNIRGGGPGRGPRLYVGEKPKNFWGTAKRLLGYLKPYRFVMVVVYSCSLLAVILNGFSPKILGSISTQLYNDVTAGTGVNFGKVLQIIIALAIVYLLNALFTYLQNFFMIKVSQKTIYSIRKDADEKLSRLPLKYYDSRTHGEILSNITNDIDTISSSFQQSLIQSVSSVATILTILVMMLTISPALTLVTLLILPASMLASSGLIKKSQVYYKGQQDTLGNINGHVEEMYTGHEIVKLFGREDESLQVFEKHNNKWTGFAWKSQFLSSIMMPIINFIGNVGYMIVCVVGALFTLNGRMNVGDIQAFLMYVRQFNQPISQTAQIANVFQSVIAAAERVFDLLDQPEEVPEVTDPVKLSDIKGQVSFEHMSFSYNEDTKLIEDFNLEVESGQTIAIVGPTGAGKTTIINLLLRFYELNKGVIKIDGVDITKMRRDDLREMFGMVLQDTWLFNGTIRENIRYGNLTATDEEVVSAADSAYADHFINTLPGGYDMVLNEEASNISQGQKQLLTIARAFLSDPDILILDEATSSVDTRTEVLIQKAMNKLKKDRTTFMIAHRLSTIQNADTILVINEGSIVEKGTHKSLLEQGGFYKSLYDSQFQNEAI